MIVFAIVLYFLAGTIFASVTHSLMLDRSVENQLLRLKENIATYRYSFIEEAKFSEKQRLEWAIRQAKTRDDVDLSMMAVLTFFFWVVVTPVFFTKRGVEYLASRKIKMFTLSKYETRLVELDKIDTLKAQALEDKKKYDAAVKLLKAEGINLGE